MDGDGIDDRPVRIAVAISFLPQRAVRGRTRYMVTVDFAGSDPQVAGSVNAVEAITYSACFYIFRCLLAEDVPATAGLMGPIQVIAPEGTIVNARPPAAVAGAVHADDDNRRGRRHASRAPPRNRHEESCPSLLRRQHPASTAPAGCLHPFGRSC